MAKHEIVTYTSDLTGAEGASPREVRFAFDIDLTDAEWKTLEDLFLKYQAKGRSPGRTQRSTATTRIARPGAISSKALARRRNEGRLWLQQHGYDVQDRGRIGVAEMAAFEAKIPHPLWAERQQAREAARERELAEAMANSTTTAVNDILDPESTSTDTAKALAVAVTKAPRRPRQKAAQPGKVAEATPVKAVAAAGSKTAVTSKVTEIPPAAKTRSAATTNNVVEAKPKTTRARKTAVPPVEKAARPGTGRP